MDKAIRSVCPTLLADWKHNRRLGIFALQRMHNPTRCCRNPDKNMMKVNALAAPTGFCRSRNSAAPSAAQNLRIRYGHQWIDRGAAGWTVARAQQASTCARVRRSDRKPREIAMRKTALRTDVFPLF
jgi:hypothetical protein